MCDFIDYSASCKNTMTSIIFAVFFFFSFLVFTRNLEVDDGMDMDMEKPTNENIDYFEEVDMNGNKILHNVNVGAIVFSYVIYLIKFR